MSETWVWIPTDSCQKTLDTSPKPPGFLSGKTVAQVLPPPSGIVGTK